MGTLPGLAQFGEPTIVNRTEIEAYDNGMPFQAITHEDLDGDQLPDILAIGKFDTLNAPIWYKNLGGSTYAPGQFIGSGYFFQLLNVLAMDLTGDGLPEVITTIDADFGGGGPVTIGYYLNQAGSFAASPVLIDVLNPGSGAGNYYMRTGDLDGDGDKDLVLGLSTSNVERRIWYYPNTSPGLGNAITLTTSGAPFLQGIEIADVDNDLDQDVVYIVSSADDRVGVLFNQGASFTNVVVDNSQMNWQDMAVADVDNDGYVDVLCTSNNHNTVRVVRNNGDNTFSAPVTFTVGTGDVTATITVADVNGDLFPDLLIPLDNERITVVLENAANGLVGYAIADTLGYNAINLLPIDTLSGLSAFLGYGDGGIIRHVLDQQTGDWSHDQLSNDVPATEIHYRDWDDDGLVDLMMPSDWGGVLWFRNLGGLNFDRSRILFDPQAEELVKVQTLDVDNDQDLDLMLEGTDRLYVLPNLGAGQWGAPTLNHNYASVYNTRETVDLDLDGDLDIIVFSPPNVIVLLNDGLGSFTQANYQNSNINNVGYTDLDQDGLLDVLCNATTLGWMRNLGGTFAALQTIQAAPPQVYSFQLSDMDGDGHEDLITGGDPVLWMRNTGVFGFDAMAPLVNSFYPSYHQLDIDADGWLDLFHHINDTMYWYRNLGNGVMDPLGTPIPTSPLINVVSGWSAPEKVADLDGDGDVDLAYAGSDSYSGTQNLMLGKNFTFNSGLGGTVFIDEDADGAHAPGEPEVAYRNVSLAPNGQMRLSDLQGGYRFAVDSGNYTLTCPGVWDPGIWQLSLGAAGYTITLPPDSSIEDLDFGLMALQDSGLVEVSLTLGTAPCWGENSMWVSLLNQGSRVEAGEVVVALDTLFTFVSSTPPPDAINGHVLTYAFDSLDYFSLLGIQINVEMPSTFYIGAALNTLSTVNTVDSLGAPSGSYSDSLQFILACSYDPNDKQVSPAGYGIFGAVDIGQEELEYTVRFQNTGNAPAYLVRIEDELPGGVDPLTLELVGYSHTPTDVRIDDGVLKVEFNGIMLVDSGVSFTESQGYVRFRCAVVPGQPHLTSIENDASIFFDYNAPVITNTALNTLVDCALFSAGISAGDVDSLIADAGDHYQWYLEGDSVAGANGQWLIATVPGNYTVEVVSIHGCVDLSDVHEVIFTGINDPERIQMMVRPNPATGNALLLCSEVLGANDWIDLLDVNGRVHRSWTGNGTREVEIERGDLPSGLYLIRTLRNGAQLGAARLVVE